MKTNDYLGNPLVADGYYNVKCLDVEVKAVATPTCPNPLVIAKFQVVPSSDYGDAQNVILYVTLRQSEGASELHETFRKAFRIKTAYGEAVGRFGCIKVQEGNYMCHRRSDST